MGLDTQLLDTLTRNSFEKSFNSDGYLGAAGRNSGVTSVERKSMVEKASVELTCAGENFHGPQRSASVGLAD